MIALGVFVSLTLLAQKPMRPQGQRVLPNQFRDFLDHQQRMEMGRPQIERKDGKVIITMSEMQFKRMQQMRMNQQRGFHPVVMRQQVCSKCEHKHKRHPRRHK